jgi:transposase InsO family protein
MPEPNPEKRLNWERFRFAIIGPLLAAPPQAGELQGQLRVLAQKQWIHPCDPTRHLRVSRSTIERWYYKALRSKNPVDALKRRKRADYRKTRVVSPTVLALLEQQYQQNPHWSVQLHHDNLRAVAHEDAKLVIPSYSTLLRVMRSRGWRTRQRLKRNTDGAMQAQQRLQEREVRSFEVDHVNALWHLDYHHGSLKIARADGQWKRPKLLGIIDDRSRLLCHLQWYWEEDTRTLVHGFCQALQKRGLPRAVMSDNGSAMTSDEFTQGLHRLGILHETTLPYSPYQNGKQEVFWAKLEGRLMAMLTDVKDLCLKRLNDYTHAWVEQDYHRHPHRELATTPLQTFLNHQNVSRPCPSSQTLEQVFARQVTRKQRRSDGTISVAGCRFEIPNAYRHLDHITLRYTQWDLSKIDMVDPDRDVVIKRLFPWDKSANANGLRRAITQQQTMADPAEPKQKQPPALLAKMLRDQNDTGLPPAYIPLDTEHEEKKS